MSAEPFFVNILAMSFAVIKTGGKQYLVKEGDNLLIEKLNYQVGEEFNFDQILMIGNGSAEEVKIGQPIIQGVSVKAKVLEHLMGDKKIVFKYKSKTRYKKKKGHRQPYTKVEILKISP